MKALLLMLSPFAPHIAEEMWENMGFKGMCSTQAWPEYDESKTVEAEKTMAVQVNGKLRSTITVATDSEDQAVIDAACADPKIAKMMEGMQLVKSIVVKNKLVNLILKPQS